MLVTVLPSVRQIERYAQSALNGFEDLSTDLAIENARCELRSLLIYLSRLKHTDDAICESFIRSVESEIIVKLNVRDPQLEGLAAYL